MKSACPPNHHANAFAALQFCSVMNRYHFTTLEEVQQAHHMLRKAVLVASRREGFYKAELYQSGQCYYEVYRHAHFNVIIRIARFTDTVYLEPYLHSISIDGLLSF